MSSVANGLRWVLMRSLAVAASVYFAFYHRWRREGMEHIPRYGPLLVEINHVSALDLPLAGASLVLKGYTPGLDMFTAAKHELWRHGWLRPILALFGLFSLNRERTDLSAMRQMVTIFRRGHILGIAPEGTRSPTGHLQLFQPGVAKLVISQRVPVLPVAVIGTDKAMPIGARFPRPVPVTVRFGPVFELSAYYDRELTPDVLACAAHEMRAHLAELLPEWMREVPPDKAEARRGAYHSAPVVSKN